MARLLEVGDVAKSFGGVSALRGVSLAVDDAQPFWGLIGPNGSGKSTLFNVLSGAYAPDRGAVRFDDRDIAGLPPWTIVERGLGRTFQIPRVFGRLTVEENVLVGASRADRTTRKRVNELLDLFDLGPLADVRADRLSIGEEKLVELARILLQARRLVLLDEVAAGIHPDLVGRIAGYLRRVAESGVRFFLIEHNMSFLMDLCSYVYVLDEGKLIAEGTPAEVQSNVRVVETYLGPSGG